MKKEKKNVDNKQERVKYRSEEQDMLIKFIIIIAIIVGIVLIVYFISDKVANKNEYNYDSVTAGVIDDSIVSIGTMLNRPFDEYYVAIYNREDNEAIYYSTIINSYSNKEESLMVYFCDLSNMLNKDFIADVDESSNPNAKTINELSLKEFTFIKVKNGEIVKYLENIEDVKTELGL